MMRVVAAVLDVTAALVAQRAKSGGNINATSLVKAFGGVVLKLEIAAGPGSNALDSHIEHFMKLSGSLCACVEAATGPVTFTDADSATSPDTSPALLGLLLSLTSGMATKSLKHVANINTSGCIEGSCLSLPGQMLTVSVVLLSWGLLLTYRVPINAATAGVQIKLTRMLEAYLPPCLRMLLQCSQQELNTSVDTAADAGDRKSISCHLGAVLSVLRPLLMLRESVSSSSKDENINRILPLPNAFNLSTVKILLNNFLLSSSARVSGAQLLRHHRTVGELLGARARVCALSSETGAAVSHYWWVALHHCYCVRSCLAFFTANSAAACVQIEATLSEHEYSIETVLQNKFYQQGSAESLECSTCVATTGKPISNTKIASPPVPVSLSVLCSKYNLLRHLVVARYYRLNASFRNGDSNNGDSDQQNGENATSAVQPSAPRPRETKDDIAASTLADTATATATVTASSDEYGCGVTEAEAGALCGVKGLMQQCVDTLMEVQNYCRFNVNKENSGVKDECEGGETEFGSFTADATSLLDFCLFDGAVMLNAESNIGVGVGMGLQDWFSLLGELGEGGFQARWLSTMTDILLQMHQWTGKATNTGSSGGGSDGGGSMDGLFCAVLELYSTLTLQETCRGERAVSVLADARAVMQQLCCCTDGEDCAGLSGVVKQSVTRLEEVVEVASVGLELLKDKLAQETSICQLLQEDNAWVDGDAPVRLLRSFRTDTAVSVRSSLVAFEKRALQCVEAMRPGSSSGLSSGSSPWVKHSQCYLLLLLCKTMLYVGGAHTAVLQWCKHALAVLMSLPGSKTQHAQWNGYFCSLRVEFLVLAASVFEQAGDISHSMAYLIEATTIAAEHQSNRSFNGNTSGSGSDSGNISGFLTLGNASTVQLLIHAYSVRTWHRTGNASRLSRSLTALRAIASCPAATSGSAAVTKLLEHFVVLTATDDQESPSSSLVVASSNSNSDNSSVGASSIGDLMHLSHSWDRIGRFINELNAAGKVQVPAESLPLELFDTCMSVAVKLDILSEHFVGAALAERDADRILVLHAVDADAQTNDFGVLSPKEREGRKEKERSLGACVAFDVNRFLRRRAATNCIHNRRKDTQDKVHEQLSALRCFVLTAGSSFCSMEFSGSSRFPHADVVEGVAALLASATWSSGDSTSTSYSSCEAAALVDIRTILRSLNGDMEVESASNQSADVGGNKNNGKDIDILAGNIICAMAMDTSAKRLIISRFSTAVIRDGGRCCSHITGQHCVSLPVTEPFRQQLAQWAVLMAENQAQLGETRDLVALSQWTEKDKKAWWNRRFDMDDAIKNHLSTLQEHLGVWTCLFEGDDLGSGLQGGGEGDGDQWLLRLTNEEVDCIHRGLLGGQAASEREARVTVLGVLQFLSPWLRLLVPNYSSSSNSGGGASAFNSNRNRKHDLFAVSTHSEQVAATVADIAFQYALSVSHKHKGSSPSVACMEEVAELLIASYSRRDGGTESNKNECEANSRHVGAATDVSGLSIPKSRKTLAFDLGGEEEDDEEEYSGCAADDALVQVQSPGSGPDSPVLGNSTDIDTDTDSGLTTLDLGDGVLPSSSSGVSLSDQFDFASEPEPALDFDGMKVTELKEHCKQHNIPINGKKADLVDRLKTHQAAAAMTAAAAVPPKQARLAASGPFYVAPATAYTSKPISKLTATSNAKATSCNRTLPVPMSVSKSAAVSQPPLTPFTPMRGGATPAAHAHAAFRTPHTAAKLAPARGLSTVKPSFKTPSKTPRKTPGISIFQEGDDDDNDELETGMSLLCVTPAAGGAANKKVVGGTGGALGRKTPGSAAFTGGKTKHKPSSSSSSFSAEADARTQAPENRVRGHVLFILDELLQPLPLESMPALQRSHRSCSRMPGLASVLISAKLRSQAATARTCTRTSTDGYGDAGGEKGSETGADPASKVSKSKGTKGIKLSKSSAKTATTAAVAVSEPNNVLVPLPLSLPLDLQQSWYVVDPERNLSGTRATMGALLQPFARSYGWKGFVGEVPSEAVVKQLHEAADLFIFCGHGYGHCLLRDSAATLKKFQSCPAALLWGCSSGALPRLGIHDPAGVVCAYLSGGAPFVVGNLWDVTERDIDTLSANFMSNLLSSDTDGGEYINDRLTSSSNSHDANAGTGTTDTNSGDDKSLSSSRKITSALLSAARSTCKLKYAVGAASVMYGLPVKIK